MKTFTALFGSAIAAIAVLLSALLFGGCTPSQPTPEQPIPVVPTTLVYSIDAPGGFDREAIAHSQTENAKPETFFIEGKSDPLTLAEPFETMENDTDNFFNIVDLQLADELGEGFGTEAYTTEISVLKAVTCKSIVDREPVSIGESFDAEAGRVWCHTQVALPAGKSGLIQHIWKRDDVEQHRVELYVSGPSYRTSSYKTVDTRHKGFWTVEIATENGDVLDTVAFEVK